MSNISLYDIDTNSFLDWCKNNPQDIEESLENTVTNYNMFIINNILDD
ncbi:MAG: hypothetical protein J6N78_02095 [Clostridia bacterium]|nr:hypothetical protein [Clostridia bacterium]